MSKMSRRNFLAASGAAAVAAMGAGTALAATSTSADTSDAMNEAEEKATSGAQEGVGVDDSYVVSLKNGLPKWSFEIAPDPIADEDIAEVVEDDIIVVGASAGGLEALRTIVAGLPRDLPAAICLVVHLAGLDSFGISYLAPFSGVGGARALLRPRLVREPLRDPLLRPLDRRNQGEKR